MAELQAARMQLHHYTEVLWCSDFKEKLNSQENFNPAHILGSKNLRASVFKEHAETDMNKQAMLLHWKSCSSNVTESMLVMKALSMMAVP